MNPDDLLAEIRELLDEYLALGEDTPVAAEAQALAAAIDGGGGMASPDAPPDAVAMADEMVGAMNPEGAPPPPMEGAPMPDMGAMPPMPSEAPEGYSGKSMKEARGAAKDFLNMKKKTKA